MNINPYRQSWLCLNTFRFFKANISNYKSINHYTFYIFELYALLNVNCISLTILCKSKSQLINFFCWQIQKFCLTLVGRTQAERCKTCLYWPGLITGRSPAYKTQLSSKQVFYIYKLKVGICKQKGRIHKQNLWILMIYSS